MKKLFFPLMAGSLLVASLVTLSGCSRRSSGPDVPQGEPKAIEAAKAPVNIFDKKLASRISSEMYSRERTEDGHLRIAVNLRNRTTKKLHIQARTVFKDFNGVSTGDETAWENLYFAPQQVLTFRANSRMPDAEIFTVEVRKP